MSCWNKGGHYQGLILEIGAEDLSRVGNCWMKGRLIVGDLVICDTHAGDGFWNYMLVEHNFYTANGRPGYRVIPQSKFGAYVLGTPYRYQPVLEEAHLLLGLQTINLAANPEQAFGRVQAAP